MNREELKTTDTEQETANPAPGTATHIVTADAVQAEEVPTIPIGSLETISTLQPEVLVHAMTPTRIVSVPTPLVVQPEEYRRSLGEWLQIWMDGARIAYLPLALLPVLLGSALAWAPTVTTRKLLGQFHLTHFLGTIVVIILLQIGANLINDYYDYMRGIDTSNVFGPGGLIQQGVMKPTRVLMYGLSALGIGALFGLIIAQQGGPLVYLFGLIGLVCAYFYSATKRALSSMALGEVVAFIVFGPLITLGSYLVQTGGHLNATPFIYSIPLGLLAAAVIHVNNLRDIEGDIYSNKRTLASILGVTWSRVAYLLLLVVAYAIIIVLGVPHRAPHLILLALWTLPVLVVAITGVLRTDAPAGFNMVLRQTLKLATFFGIFLVLGLMITALLPVLPHFPAHLLPF